MLPELFRHTTFNAGPGVERFLSQGGPNAVFTEVEQIHSDHVAGIYLELLMERADLSTRGISPSGDSSMFSGFSTKQARSTRWPRRSSGARQPKALSLRSTTHDREDRSAQAAASRVPWVRSEGNFPPLVVCMGCAIKSVTWPSTPRTAAREVPRKAPSNACMRRRFRRGPAPFRIRRRSFDAVRLDLPRYHPRAHSRKSIDLRVTQSHSDQPFATDRPDSSCLFNRFPGACRCQPCL